MKALIENKHVLVNALLFQVVWFVAILGDWFWALPIVALMLVHLLLSKTLPFMSLLPLCILAIVGVSFDSVLNYLGVYQFSVGNVLLPFFDLPVWLASLWLGFCLTLPLSLAWLIKKPYLFVIGCSLLGPVSYLAGRRFEALFFTDANLWLLALEWCVFSIIALFILFPKLGVSKASPIFLKKETAC